MSALLEVSDVSIRFPTASWMTARISGQPRFIEAVSHASFVLEPGRTYALVGESGSGKTTLARAIIGLVPLHRGGIIFAGKTISGASEFPSAAGAARDRHDLPGSGRLAQPPSQRAGDPRRTLQGAWRNGRYRKEGRRASGRCRFAQTLRRTLSASTVRRPGAAGQRGAGTGAASQTGDRGRADCRARRLDPGGDPQSHARPAGAAMAWPSS